MTPERVRLAPQAGQVASDAALVWTLPITIGVWLSWWVWQTQLAGVATG